MSERKSSPHNISVALRRLESAAGNGHSQLGQDIETIRRAIEDLKPHLSQLKNDVARAAGESLEEPIRRAKEAWNQSSQSAREMGKNVDRQVHEHPWWALGIVGLITFLIGYLMGRRD